MLKYLIYKKEDGDLIIQGFTEEFSKKTFEELIQNHRLPNSDNLKIYPFEGCQKHHTAHDNCCDFPSTDHVDKWHIEDGKIKTDHNWEKVLIPHSELSRKHRARCLKKIEEEHSKDSPDPVKLSKLQWEYEKCKEWGKVESHHIYEVALKNLDEDNLKKPLIREKLKSKIQELKK